MTLTPAQLGRPVGAVGEETRQRIIAATMRCVAEVGCSRATIREIARAADMTSGSLYHYFPNKSALLGATVAAVDEIALPRLRAAARSGIDVVDRLEAVLDESDRLIREYPYLIAFERAIRAESAANPRGADPDRSGFTPLRDIVGDIITDARRQGALAAGADAQGTIDMISALAWGLTEQAANLPLDAYHATLRSAKQLIRGTLL
ncbi:MAG TPA: helix-turn-helix domain-containing protein [Mycobacterium sp.]|nr:helix-turn-helix domain-containing protein [Mycobacterium sp.]